MNVTTLNITAGTLKVLFRQGTALNWLEAPLSPASIKNGLVLEPETLGREIKALFQNNRLSAGRVVCAVNGLPFTYRLFNVPALDGASLDEAVARMARQEMAISPDEMYLAWQAYPGADGEYQVLAAGVTRRPVDNLIKTLSAAGISPYLLDFPHLALARLCPYPDAVIVDFEKDCSNIVMVVDGIPRGLNMVPGLAAEASIQDQIGQVMDKLARMVEFYNSSHPENPLKDTVKLLVTGELLEDVKTIEDIRSRTVYAVEPLALKYTVSGGSANRIAVNSGMLDIRSENDKHALPCRCLGLSAVVRGQHPKADVGGVFKKIAVPLAVFAGLCILALSYLSLHKAQADLDTVQSRLDIAKTALVNKQAASQDAAALTSKIQAVNSRSHDIQAGRQAILAPRGYVQEVAAVMNSLPENVAVNGLDVNAGTISLDGIAADTDSVVAFAAALESSGSFSQAVITSLNLSNIQPDNPPIIFKMSLTR